MRARRIAVSAVVCVGVLFAANAALPNATSAVSPHKFFPSALTPAQIATLSANPDERVIILLANQHPEVPGTVANLPSRAKALASDQASLLGELKTVKAPKTHGYSFINAVSATVSHDEAVRLASESGVAAVIPDVTSVDPASVPTAPAATPATPKVKSATTSKAAATPNGISLPGSGVCPSNPSNPILEPEALSLMNANNSPAAGANDLADGSGVKVAVFPDGLDPNIANFIRPSGPDAGHSAIFDYQDFTGEGAGAKTGGEEAFGDASSIIAQGVQTFDLSGEVNPAHPLPVGCNIQIKGVAPGASLAVMKVFGDSNLAFDSVILEGMEYAVEVDHVDILSESFGSNPIPNNASDPISIFDNDATQAGISVVVSSGDAGITNTIGSPATSPDVISAGATTSFRLYSQTGSYGYGGPGGTGWESNNVSSFSSSGTTENGQRTIDVVAPGESGWADCSTNTTTFTECSDIYNGAHPQPIVAFGGTSQSAPLTAGTAALVIEAYRDTHHGATPSPALVKQIIVSSAQTIDAPSNDQGAGLVDSWRAVKDAESIHDSHGSPAPLGSGLLYSPGQISGVGAPNSPHTSVVTVTNLASTAQTVNASLKALTAPSTLASGTLTLNQATDPTFIFQTGATVGDVHQVPIQVPSGLSELDARIGWLTNGANSSSIVRATLFDPSGAIASDTRPQGAAGGYGDDLVQDPAAGTWTLLVFETATYNGPLAYTVTGQRFTTVSTVSPASRVIPAGGSAPFTVIATTPSTPGDVSDSLTFSTNSDSDRPLAIVPVLLRSTVPVLRGTPGSFSGTLTGGNARAAFYGQELSYQFNVPTGTPEINVNVAVAHPGYEVFGFLVDPTQSPVDVQTTVNPEFTANLQTLHLSWVNPTAGLWTLDLAQVNGVSAAMTSTPITGTVDFNGSGVTATGLPTNVGTQLPQGQPVTATVHITNNGNSPAIYSVDPRLSTSSEIPLASLSDPSDLPLPVSNPSTIPQFVLPPFSSRIDVGAESTVPIDLTTSPNFGNPEGLATTGGDVAIATISRPDLPASVYSCGPNEVGPFSGVAPSTTFSCGADAVTATFDPSIESDTGNIWSFAEGFTGDYSPLELYPGQSGTITVTITPSAAAGTKVTGTLAIETFSNETFSSDQVAALPYTYRVR